MHVTPPTIDDYVPAYAGIVQMMQGVDGNSPGDPEQCVARVIDVVKAEGMAANKPTPAVVPLGSDAYLTIKKYAEGLLMACNEWESLAKSVDFARPRRGFFEHVEHYYF